MPQVIILKGQIPLRSEQEPLTLYKELTQSRLEEVLVKNIKVVRESQLDFKPVKIHNQIKQLRLEQTQVKLYRDLGL